MNALVIPTYDITPEQWADFAKTAAIPPSTPDGKLIVPYILVHSPTQENLKEETERISTTDKTEFSSATWQEIRDTVLDLAEREPLTIHTRYFLILDKQSTEDRRVIVMERDGKWVNAEGQERWPLPGDYAIKITMWKRHRVPFEEAWETVALISAEGGLEEEPYLEEVMEEQPE
ncbi:uncharacterized protein BDZ99DRAFT_567991 [Mytilinidion resinicola]|uniref:Uncharacterized protein n=1 Tax=Mytilinidion resinicola TaxID=574789 RepID=A0A6A6Z299_9PEZI|nr:uncharacterized protein BDZ99DRAFT_567991 [Mytilinidion resinicola]KAF2814357.1 hypothetical protein BDZ99DRAFT_567991 [Mytilinidion resinicola]